ncbi:hypothetical protein COV16_02785 [Candidatus Woesearchaeota archaeon CG10_big_fil_rev_8_21_14_0_10_34_8]|nr:MAG: hypothetical protein COV16_02785 [Candidatus Woesearchaeota archaeon CG10_big_fil_rev_8_21_14_0_10_34_8]
MIKAFIFDMDGTIVNTESLHRQAFNILLRKYDIYITKKVWHSELVGTSSKFIANKYITKYNLPEDLNDFVSRRRYKYQRLLKKYGINYVKGFKQFISNAKKRGFKLIIASSGQRLNIQSSMKAVGLHNINFVGIEDVNHRKPNPELFLKAAKRLKVKPKECIVFEDSSPGVEAAKRAGMKVVALLTTSSESKLRKLKPNLIVKDYTELVFEETV